MSGALQRIDGKTADRLIFPVRRYAFAGHCPCAHVLRQGLQGKRFPAGASGSRWYHMSKKRKSPARVVAKIVLLRYLSKRIARKDLQREEARMAGGMSGRAAGIRSRADAVLPAPEKLIFHAIGGSSASIVSAGSKLAARQAKELRREERKGISPAGRLSSQDLARSAHQKRPHRLRKLLLLAAIHELTKKPDVRKMTGMHLSEIHL